MHGSYSQALTIHYTVEANLSNQQNNQENIRCAYLSRGEKNLPMIRLQLTRFDEIKWGTEKKQPKPQTQTKLKNPNVFQKDIYKLQDQIHLRHLSLARVKFIRQKGPKYLENNCKKFLAKIISGNRCSTEIKRSAHKHLFSAPASNERTVNRSGSFLRLIFSLDKFLWQQKPRKVHWSILIDLIGRLGISATWRWNLMRGFVSRQIIMKGA